MKKIRNIQNQTGVTLIEALVSLLIFTIGALGLAALQLSSLSASADNEQRSLAVWKTQELVDRIKSNPGLEAAYITAIDNNVITDLGGDTVANSFTCPAAQPKLCVGASANCSDAEIVAYDVWEVLCQANTGVVNTAAIVGTVGEFDTRVYGSSGFNQLEVILRQLPEDNDADGTDDGTGDLELFFEWVSQEAERSEDVVGDANGNGTIQTNLCGTEYPINSKLEAYCVRFR